ncbi:MAG: hypothetical protein ACFHWZ_06495 [Phycisphaerales bacterium]
MTRWTALDVTEVVRVKRGSAIDPVLARTEVVRITRGRTSLGVGRNGDADGLLGDDDEREVVSRADLLAQRFEIGLVRVDRDDVDVGAVVVGADHRLGHGDGVHRLLTHLGG